MNSPAMKISKDVAGALSGNPEMIAENHMKGPAAGIMSMYNSVSGSGGGEGGFDKLKDTDSSPFLAPASNDFFNPQPDQDLYMNSMKRRMTNYGGIG